MAVNRGAPLTWAFIAGAMASRNGSATVAPMPRMNVRRGNASLVITIEISLQNRSTKVEPYLCLIAVFLSHPHCKRSARHNPLNQRFELVVLPRGVPLDFADRRRVGGFQAPAQRIHHQLFRH